MTIISFAHKFVFLKTTKTAGTSIEVDLSTVVEDEAVVTPILPAAEGHRPRNWLTEEGDPAFYNHMPATEIRSRIGVSIFAGMHKFCVEREPVQKCISHFHMLRNSPLHNPGGKYQASWAEYCAAGRFPVDTAKYTERLANGKLVMLVDTVLPYERLETTLAEFLGGFGLPNFRLTARQKSEYSQNRLVHPDDVTAAERDRIYEAFAQTIKLTGLYQR